MNLLSTQLTDLEPAELIEQALFRKEGFSRDCLSLSVRPAPECRNRMFVYPESDDPQKDTGGRGSLS